MTLTLAASNGARQYAQRLIESNFDPSELFVGRDKEISNTGAPDTAPQEYDESVSSVSSADGANFQFKMVTDEDVQDLKKYPFVEQVRETYSIPLQYVTRESQKRYTASAQVYNPAQRPELASGALPDEGDIAKGGVLLPDSYLAGLGFASAEDALGREVSVSVSRSFGTEFLTSLGVADAANQQNSKLVKFKIVAVTKKSATSFTFGISPLMFSSADSRELYDFAEKGTQNYNKYTYVYVRVKDGNNESNIKEAQDILNRDGYFTQSVKEIQKSILQIVNALQIVVMVFGFITLIASIFGIVNTQYISVLERTREIGLMKALGMRRKDISRLFILEAVWIGFLGGVLGSLFALIVGVVLNPTISKAIGFEPGKYILVFRPLDIVLLVIGLMIIAMVAGLLPARKAAKLDPIEALRTE